MGLVTKDIRLLFDDIENIIVSGEVFGLAFRVVVVYLKDDKVRLHAQQLGLNGLFGYCKEDSVIGGMYLCFGCFELLFVIFIVLIVCFYFFFR